MEGQFTLRNVTDPVVRYYHVLSALPKDAVQLIRHVLLEDTGPASYDNLRISLLSSHSLSKYQKMERMMRLPPLGDWKPSVMLAKMLDFCPAGKSATAVFAYLFLQRLPREISILLSEDDPADMQAIADKAGRLIAMHVPQGHDACAIISAADKPKQELVAAIGGAWHKKKLPAPKRPQHQQQGNSGQRGGSSHRNVAQATVPLTSMCFYHARFGKKAKYCEEGCLWPEN